MQATYSFPEIKSILRTLDFASVNILKELVEEEKECFADYELRAIQRFIQIKTNQFLRNEIKVEYLLSFN